jgi:hypothetical protein
LAAVSVVVTLLIAGGATSAQQVQPGYDVIRVVDDSGNAIPYGIWVAWAPTIVTTPDGGAWAFFSALPLGTGGVGVQGVLYAARFDPASGVWQPATRIPGGAIQFGATAVADGEGRIHLIYSDRAITGETEEGNPIYGFSTLFYRVFDGSAWSEPVAVAPDENAGHQLSPQIVIDGSGGLHAVWQEQRSRPDEQRDLTNAASSSNADIFASDFADGAWQAPVQVHPPLASPSEVASRPYVAVDGDRLVAIWSVYPGTTAEDLRSAARVEWSARPLGDPANWSAPATLLEKGENDSIGGRLLDLASDPRGGVVVLLGRDADQRVLAYRRLEPGQTDWSAEVSVSAGTVGAYPAIAVAADGTTYAVFENGSGPNVDVGAVALAPGATIPGANTVVSPAEIGAQGRPNMTIDQNGTVWVIYFHQPEGSQAIEVRVLRGARISAEPATTPTEGTPEG